MSDKRPTGPVNFIASILGGLMSIWIIKKGDDLLKRRKR